MPATIAKAFIPRILGNVTISQIRDAFAAKQIGKVKNIDMHCRKNEKNNLYSFAFLELALYDTKEATQLCEDILDNGSSKVFYDRKNYWEVKAFLTKKERSNASIATSTPTSITPTFVSNATETLCADADDIEDSEIVDICEKLSTPHMDNNTAWLKMTIHSQLLHAIHSREMEQSICYNCGNASNPEYQSSIFWKNYAFCSDWCQYDTEYDIRKSWRRSQKAKQVQEPGLTVLQQLYIDDASIITTSKFIDMFERIQNEANEEMRNIRSICYELMKRPTVFTAEDRYEMLRYYEALENEIIIA